MLQAIEAFEAARGVGPAAVLCTDGATRSGLFLAAHHLVERLGRDRFVDLFHTLKALKLRRHAVVGSAVSHASNCLLASSAYPLLNRLSLLFAYLQS